MTSAPLARRAPGQPAIYLHIGTPKSGTTFVQKLLEANRDRLAGDGVLFAGQRWKQQVRAVQDVLNLMRQDPLIDQSAEGAWDRLAAQMLGHRGRAALISMEFLCSANREQAARIVESFPGADVHVLLTVRTATATIPGQWQSRVRNGARLSWAEYVRGLLAAEDRSAADNPAIRMLRVSQGVPRMLATWTSVVPEHRVHVVTTPATTADPMLLWRRFSGVLGVDPALATQPAARSNRTLGLPSTELIRRLNDALGDVRRTRYQPTMNQFLAQRVLSERTGTERPVALDRAGLEFAARWNRRVRQAIESAGAEVVGDLAELPDGLSDGQLRDAEHAVLEAGADEVLLAAGDARLGLAGRIAVLESELRDLGVGGEPRRRGAGDEPRERSLGDEPPAVWSQAADPVGAAVNDLVVLVRRAMRLRERCRRARRARRSAMPR